MNALEFEQRYRSEGDPWGYRSSDYEREKYAATLRACGPGPFAEALELGGSIGVFSALLAPRCRQLTTLDFSSTAVAEARRELAPYPHAQARLGEIPAAIPDGPFDLVVASEILYYLEPDALAGTLARLEGVCAAGARLVAVHWRPAGAERPFSAAAVHDALLAEPWLRPLRERSTDAYLLHVLERR
jgi:trans-aconitate methyltransferase